MTYAVLVMVRPPLRAAAAELNFKSQRTFGHLVRVSYLSSHFRPPRRFKPLSLLLFLRAIESSHTCKAQPKGLAGLFGIHSQFIAVAAGLTQR